MASYYLLKNEDNCCQNKKKDLHIPMELFIGIVIQSCEQQTLLKI